MVVGWCLGQLEQCLWIADCGSLLVECRLWISDCGGSGSLLVTVRERGGGQFQPRGVEGETSFIIEVAV